MIHVADIQRIVAAHYGIAPECMKEPDGLGARCDTKVKPRQLAMFFARELCTSRHSAGHPLLPMSYPQIGRLFGNRDHSTVMHSVRTIEEKLQKSKQFADEIAAIKNMIAAVENSHGAPFVNGSAGA